MPTAKQRAALKEVVGMIAPIAPVTAETIPGAGVKPTSGGVRAAEEEGRAGSIPAAGTPPKLLPLGIHFNLDEDKYHADPALGSGNLRQLAKNPCDYWYESWMNPNREPQPEKEHYVYGRAQHRIIFDGREAFDAQFLCGPDQTGMTTAEKTASTKAANAQAATLGKLMLKRPDYNRIVIGGHMVTRNPHLKDVFSGGHGEVSFFWVRDGVRLKARFDYLKCVRKTLGMVAANGDLKTVENQRGRWFPTACYHAINDYGYHVQAAHYMEGLMLVPLAIMSDAVHCHREEVPGEWLSRFLAPGLRFGWQWIFLQKTGAPITHSLTLSPQNKMLDEGRDTIERALQLYRQYMEQAGPDQMWLLIEPPQEAAVENLPGRYGR